MMTQVTQKMPHKDLDQFSSSPTPQKLPAERWDCEDRETKANVLDPKM